MRRMGALLLAVAAIAACSPKERREWTPDRAERLYLEGWAGRIARSLVPPCDTGSLDPNELQQLMSRCDSVPERYVYLYARISDSIQAVTPPEPGCVQEMQQGDGRPADSLPGEPVQR